MKKGDTIGKHLAVENISLEAKVNWVVDEEAGITFTAPETWKGGSKVVPTAEWKVTVEAAPSYQSSVESMSVTQLQDSLDLLRRTRVSAPVRIKRGAIAKTPPISNDPMAKALASMTPEKKAALMRKLGMVD